MLSSTDIQHFRDRLLALKRRLRGDFASLQDEALRNTGGEASGSLSDAPVHPADLGTDNFDEELTLDLLDNQQQLALEIGAALERIDHGTYGRCENCGRDIPRERLEAVPWTHYCVRCAEKFEEQEQKARA
jgi:RNA polymerase-binding protein DksA